MSKRRAVLMSAFACEPNTGSEPEVGWQWALQMARFHDVCVLTREHHRAGIEEELNKLRGTRPLPEFIYHADGALVMRIYDRFKTFRLNYFLWQRSAWHLIERLQRERKFELIHHATYAGYRFGTAIWGHGAPTVWGPVGGIYSIPRHLLPWNHPPSLAPEVFRQLNNLVQGPPFNALARRARKSTITLASTEETQQMFRAVGCESILMPAIGLNVSTMPAPDKKSSTGPLKVLFLGKVITLKGIDLAIEAMGETKANANFTIVGDGKYMARGKKLAKDLGIAAKVNFRGRVPAQEALRVYYDYDVFLFPSLHDTGGFAAIEAMTCGLPVICLDCGGPRLAVREGAGIRVPMGGRREIISGLARAIEFYDANRGLLEAQGRVARQIVLDEYDWDRKGRQMDLIYQKAVTSGRP